jgi:hypothetical protein
VYYGAVLEAKKEIPDNMNLSTLSTPKLEKLLLASVVLACLTPAFAKHNPSDYTTPFTVRSNLGQTSDDACAGTCRCTVKIETPGHIYNAGSESPSCPYLVPGYHGYGKLGSTGRYRWFEIMWIESGNSVHYHKFYLINDTYVGP